MPDINVNLDPDVARFVEAQGPSFVQDLIKVGHGWGRLPALRYWHNREWRVYQP